MFCIWGVFNYSNEVCCIYQGRPVINVLSNARSLNCKRSDDAVFIVEHAYVLCLGASGEVPVNSQSTETQSRHRVEAESELSRGRLNTNSLFRSNFTC